MDNLDYIRANKLIRQMGYTGVKVRSHAGNYAYVLFIQEKFYKEREEQFKIYPAGSAMFKHMADYIYDYVQRKWTKELFPIQDMILTPAEMVLFGKS